MAREVGEHAIGGGWLARSASSRLAVGGQRGRRDWWWGASEAGGLTIGGGWLEIGVAERESQGPSPETMVTDLRLSDGERRRSRR